MKPKAILFILLVITSIAAQANIVDNDSTNAGNFNIEKDLLLP